MSEAVSLVDALSHFGYAGLVALVGAAGGLWAVLRREKRDDSGSQVKLTAELLELARRELEGSGRLSGRYAGELETLRAARWALDDVMTEMRDQALAARVMVHELQRRLGEPETEFPPLPRPGLPPAQAPPAV